MPDLLLIGQAFLYLYFDEYERQSRHYIIRRCLLWLMLITVLSVVV